MKGFGRVRRRGTGLRGTCFIFMNDHEDIFFYLEEHALMNPSLARVFIKEVNGVYFELLGSTGGDVWLALLPCWPSSVPVSLMETPE